MEEEGEYKKFPIMPSEIFDDLLNLKIMYHQEKEYHHARSYVTQH